MPTKRNKNSFFTSEILSENEPINKEDLDLEKLMFPAEFTSYYKLNAFIKEKINSSSTTILKENQKHSEPIAESSNPPNSLNKEVKSLKWNSADHSELNQIHKKLKEHGYLNCDLVLFKKLFLGNIKFDKITWLKTDSSLIYFYGRLIDKNKIKKPSKKWVKFKEVFEYSGSSASSLYASIIRNLKIFQINHFLIPF